MKKAMIKIARAVREGKLTANQANRIAQEIVQLPEEMREEFLRIAIRNSSKKN